MQDWKKEFDRMCRSGDVSGPPSEDHIGRAERDLGLRFPEDYRHILLTHGAVMGPGFEIYGLVDPARNDPPLWVDVVSETRMLRQLGQAGADRPGAVPFSDDGTGVHFYLDTLGSPGARVFAVGPGVDKVFDMSIFEFCVRRARGEIDLSA